MLPFKTSAFNSVTGQCTFRPLRWNTATYLYLSIIRWFVVWAGFHRGILDWSGNSSLFSLGPLFSSHEQVSCLGKSFPCVVRLSVAHGKWWCFIGGRSISPLVPVSSRRSTCVNVPRVLNHCDCRIVCLSKYAPGLSVTFLRDCSCRCISNRWLTYRWMLIFDTVWCVVACFVAWYLFGGSVSFKIS